MGEGEYKLGNPYNFYESIKNYFQKRKNYKLDIDNILYEKELNLPLIIFYFSVINLSFDFLLPYKIEEESNKKKKGKDDKKVNESEFVPIKINYDNDDVYRIFNNLVPLLTSKRRFFRKNPDQSFTIPGTVKKK